MGFDVLDQVWFGGMSDAAAYRKAAASDAAKEARLRGVRPRTAALNALLAVADDQDWDAATAADIVVSDPALTARTLYFANALSSEGTTAAASARAAVEIIGSRRLRQIAVSASLLATSPENEERVRVIAEHSVAVAELSRLLARTLHLPGDTLYLSGLLHDLGKVMFLQAGGEDYAALIDRCDADGSMIHAHERDRFGFDHSILASVVLADWLLPVPIPKLVASHHQVAPGTKLASNPMVLVLHLADRLAHSFGMQVEPEFFEQQALSHDATALGLGAAMLNTVWDRAQDMTRGTLEMTADPSMTLTPLLGTMRLSMSPLPGPVRRTKTPPPGAADVSSRPPASSGRNSRTPRPGPVDISITPPPGSVRKAMPPPPGPVDISIPPPPGSVRKAMTPPPGPVDISITPPPGSVRSSMTPFPPHVRLSIHAPSRTAVHASLPPSMRFEEPQNEMPCVICGEPSLATSCPRCRSLLCPTHEPRRLPWCSRCEHEFQTARGTSTKTWAIGAGVGVGCLLAAYLLSLAHAPSDLVGALAFLSVFAGAGVSGWLHWSARTRFLRPPSPSAQSKPPAPAPVRTETTAK